MSNDNQPQFAQPQSATFGPCAKCGKPIYAAHWTVLHDACYVAQPQPHTDDPEMDATDFAHPAWWRGHAHAFQMVCFHVNKILDGKDDGGGENLEGPWRELRRRLLALCATKQPPADVERLLAEAKSIDKSREHWPIIKRLATALRAQCEATAKEHAELLRCRVQRDEAIEARDNNIETRAIRVLREGGEVVAQ